MQEFIEVPQRRWNDTATKVIKNAASFFGVFVSAAAATPTLKVSDAAGNIINTITPAAGTLYRCPCRLRGDLTVTVSGTVDYTVLYS